MNNPSPGGVKIVINFKVISFKVKKPLHSFNIHQNLLRKLRVNLEQQANTQNIVRRKQIVLEKLNTVKKIKKHNTQQPDKTHFKNTLIKPYFVPRVQTLQCTQRCLLSCFKVNH